LQRIFAFTLARPTLPNRLAIIIKLRPLEERTAFLARHIPCMAHPEIPAPILLLPLHDPEYRGHATLALRRKLRMQISLVVAISYVDPLVAGYGVRVDGGGRGDAVFPFLLHLGVHY